MPVIRSAKAILFVLLLFLSSFVGTVVFGMIFLPIFFVRQQLYRHLFEVMVGVWEYFAAALMEFLLGIKVVISGDEIRCRERCLILMNHRTCLDWMYFWLVLVRQCNVRHEKIILKSGLKKVPGPGWAIQIAMFIFLERKWEIDKVILGKLINYFADVGHPTQILLFPEGTDFTRRAKQISDEFAKKNNLKEYEFVLHPRLTGFNFVVNEMKRRKHLDAVYDVTISYPAGGFPQNELELVAGKIPSEVHFHITRHALATLPSSTDELQNWCLETWKAKEERLRQIYRPTVDNKEESSLSAPGREGEKRKEGSSIKIVYACVLAFWFLVIIGFCYAFMCSLLVKCLTVLCVVFHVATTWLLGGWELAQADYYNWVTGNARKEHDL